MRALIAPALLLSLATTLASGTARAGADAEIGYGQRSVDFHRFTDARGAKKGLGTDVRVAGRFRKAKAPWAVGLFYSQQTYNLDPDDHYFETVRASELGIDAVIRLGDKSIVPHIGFGYTLFGTVTGKTVDPTVLRKSQGSGVATSGEATWTYDMTGAHVQPGAQWMVTKGASVLFAVDFGLQSARLDKVEVRTVDQTAAYDGYAKKKTQFNSVAVLLGIRAEP